MAMIDKRSLFSKLLSFFKAPSKKREGIRYLPSGESALVMEFGDEISKEINSKIRHAMNILQKHPIGGVQELIPTYRSITILYSPLEMSFSKLVKELEALDLEVEDSREEHVRLIEIPTLYGAKCGADLGFVAEHAKLSEEEVIKIHSGKDYLVYMLGFSPGFVYLGGMDKSIATPRLASPRLNIPAGSVGIAGEQTGIYPSESPGGWQLIGRTPVKLYDERKDPPVSISAGDYIRYLPIDKRDYERISEEVERGVYQLSIKTLRLGELNG